MARAVHAGGLFFLRWTPIPNSTQRTGEIFHSRDARKLAGLFATGEMKYRPSRQGDQALRGLVPLHRKGAELVPVQLSGANGE